MVNGMKNFNCNRNPKLSILAITAIAMIALHPLVYSAPKPKEFEGNSKNVKFAPDRILVQFKPGTKSQDKENVLNKAKGGKSNKKEKAFKFMEGLKLVTLPPGRDVKDAIAQIEKNPNVLYVEPDYEYSLNATPNDPSYNQLWGLHNTGQTIWNQAGIADVDINAPEAWNNTTGSSNVVIGVLDSGVNYSHPDLVDNMWVNSGEVANNGVDDDNNGYVDDIYGINAYAAVYGGSINNPMDENKHGTHVAGTISAVGNNGVGVTGVSQSTEIVACRIGNAAGQIFVSAAVICMDYIYDLKINKGVNIVATNNRMEVSNCLMIR